MTPGAGRIVTDFAHDAWVTTPGGTIEIPDARFAATVTAELTGVQVVRGALYCAAELLSSTFEPAKKARSIAVHSR